MDHIRFCSTLPIPHPETLANISATIVSRDSAHLVFYCRRQQCGGIYSLNAELWNLTGPISFADFLDVLRRGGVQLPDSADLQIWLDTCAPRKEDGNGKPGNGLKH
jgi:hypothetical protein